MAAPHVATDPIDAIASDDTVDGGAAAGSADVGLLAGILTEICSSYVNMALVLVIGVLLYKILRSRSDESRHKPAPAAPQLPKLRRDFTIQELKPFDGTQPDGRVLMAVNGTVYDVTKGKSFYGPGGPYSAFAGRDASRGLATFSVTASDDDKPDDLSDLSKMEMDSVNEWEMQFNEKYLVVGKLLKPGEEHTNYEDEEDESTAAALAADAEQAKKDAAPVTNVDAHGESTPAATAEDAKPKSE